MQTLATPYYWTAVWPLIRVELRENQLSRAVELARSLLEPSRARMPDELTKTLEEACAAWDAEQSEVARELLQKATAQAEKFMYL